MPGGLDLRLGEHDGGHQLHGGNLLPDHGHVGAARVRCRQLLLGWRVGLDAVRGRRQLPGELDHGRRLGHVHDRKLLPWRRLGHDDVRGRRGRLLRGRLDRAGFVLARLVLHVDDRAGGMHGRVRSFSFSACLLSFRVLGNG